MPHPHIELSVFRISALGELEVQQIGDDVARQRQKPLIARGEVEAGQIRRLGLDVAPAEPPPRHANIIGWPRSASNLKEGKGGHKLIAMQIVEVAKLILPETN